MRNPNLEFIRTIRLNNCKNHRVEVKCKLCGQSWEMWRSHYYRGDTPCNCEHWGVLYPRLYSIYNNMKTRCYNDRSPNYRNYGGRGISMCDEWRDSFREFKNWALSSGYSDELTIERVDVNGNYEPCNCTWVTSKEQAANKTTTVRVENTSLRNWCVKHGLNYKLVHQCMTRHPEMPIDDILEYYLLKRKLVGEGA